MNIERRGMSTSEYAKKMLIQDIEDIVEVILNIDKEERPIFMSAVIPYICLIINEGYNWCSKAKIQLPMLKSKDIIENIRAKGKLFGNDKYLSFDNQIGSIDKIIEMEHEYYKSLAKPYALDCFIYDIGTYWKDQFCVGNTIQYSYDLFSISKDGKLIYRYRNEIFNFSSEIGSACQDIYRAITGKNYKSNNNVSVKTKELRNVDFKFKNKFKNTRNIIIHCLICRINFILYYFKEQCRENSLLYLRISYVTFYSLKNDMEALGIIEDKIFDEYYNSKFRNIMAHYGLYNKITNDEIIQNVIGYGIIEKYFNCDYSNIVKIIEEKLLLLKQLLENEFLLDVKLDKKNKNNQ